MLSNDYGVIATKFELLGFSIEVGLFCSSPHKTACLEYYMSAVYGNSGYA